MCQESRWFFRRQLLKLLMTELFLRYIKMLELFLLTCKWVWRSTLATINWNLVYSGNGAAEVSNEIRWEDMQLAVISLVTDVVLCSTENRKRRHSKLYSWWNQSWTSCQICGGRSLGFLRSFLIVPASADCADQELAYGQLGNHLRGGSNLHLCMLVSVHLSVSFVYLTKVSH